jgi:hypothetical protein
MQLDLINKNPVEGIDRNNKNMVASRIRDLFFVHILLLQMDFDTMMYMYMYMYTSIMIYL